MSEPLDTPALTAAPAKPTAKFEDCVRKNPGSALLVAVGLGLAAVLVARALTPPPTPRSRAVRLLEDIQHRLTELTQPVYDRVASFAEDGAHAVGKGMDGIGSMHLDRKFDKLRHGIMSLFH